MDQVDVYLSNFVLTYQGVPKERHQMLRHLLRSTNTVLGPNEATDSLCKEPISTKNLCQGEASWYTKKTVLGWEIDTK